jgi:Fe-S cluster assembly protein SufD
MTTTTILPVGAAYIEAVSAATKEPAWLTNVRLEALELAGRLELPKYEKTRVDKWNISQYGQYNTEAAVASFDQLPESVKGLIKTEDASNLIVQRNASVVFSQLSEELAQQGVIFKDLHVAATEHAELVQKHLFSVIKKDENLVTALHAAAFTGGIFLYVPKNVQVEVPLQALFMHDQEDAAFSPHVLIVAEANSSVTYVDHSANTTSTSAIVRNIAIEVVVQAGANVTVASVNDLAANVTELTFRRAEVAQDGQVNWIIGEMNAGNSATDTTSILRGNGSESDAKVICVGSNDQKLSITTQAIHWGKNTNSDMVTRAAMRDEATAIINGVTKIEKGATYANGEQTERVLMLSPKARGDANPMLLIDEDEVKAGHAASVGQVNENQLYYLMSRGISREQAQKLIIYGFLAPIVTAIPIAALEAQLSEVVERKLGQ